MEKQRTTSFTPGAHVTKLAEELTINYLKDTVSTVNGIFKTDCYKNCHGCKKISGPHECEIAKRRAAYIKGLIENAFDDFDCAVLHDLFSHQFHNYFDA